MTVSELIELLQGYDADTEVHFAYNYGDRGQTTVAPVVTSVEEANVAYNAYVDNTAVVDIWEDDEDATTVLIIK